MTVTKKHQIFSCATGCYTQYAITHLQPVQRVRYDKEDKEDKTPRNATNKKIAHAMMEATTATAAQDV